MILGHYSYQQLLGIYRLLRIHINTIQMSKFIIIPILNKLPVLKLRLPIHINTITTMKTTNTTTHTCNDNMMDATN